MVWKTDIGSRYACISGQSRLGLVPSTANNPRKVEDYLMKNISTDEVSDAHHWILLHGRYVCKSAKPDCDHCPFDAICPKLMKDSKL